MTGLVDAHVLYNSLKSGTEMALGKANFLRTTRAEILQALIIYLVGFFELRGYYGRLG